MNTPDSIVNELCERARELDLPGVVKIVRTVPELQVLMSQATDGTGMTPMHAVVDAIATSATDPLDLPQIKEPWFQDAWHILWLLNAVTGRNGLNAEDGEGQTVRAMIHSRGLGEVLLARDAQGFLPSIDPE